jgi:TonB family protein
MDLLAKYLIQSSVSVMLFYMVYKLLFRGDTNFKLQRLYMVSSIIFVLVIPLIPARIAMAGGGGPYAYLLEAITINSNEVQETIIHHISLFQVMMIVYLTGIMVFSARLMLQVARLLMIIRKQGVSMVEGIRLVYINDNYTPFSFMGYIFLNPETENRKLGAMLAHERVHVNQVHSFDLLLLELLTIMQWFNPVVWLYRGSLKGIHEYLADDEVLKQGYDKLVYQGILLDQSMGIQVNDLTNNFNQSLLKRRFIMMTKTKAAGFARLKYYLALPVAMAVAVVLSLSMNTIVYGQSGADIPPPPSKSETGGQAVTVQSQKDTKPLGEGQEEQVFKVVDQMPEFEGGSNAMIKYLVENIKYPDDAKQKGISGRVFVQFVVSKTGEVKNVHLLRGVSPSLDNEALRVVSSMPDWKPGKDENGQPVNVEYNLPINFSLDENAGDKKKEK